ncbi:hypothetical protein [Thiolapillus sp.]
MSNAVSAWLLKTGGAIDLALGNANLVQLLDEPRSFTVPAAPLHARSVLLWQDQVLSILDPHAWLFGSRQKDSGFVAVVAYQMEPMEPLRYGAILLPEVPQSIEVEDNMACKIEHTLPESVQAAYISSFATAGHTALVPDLASIFENL